MLTELSINNYALIDKLTINLNKGLSIITGETGAGKSILLGALGLVLGNRADLASLKDGSKKSIVEAKVHILNYNLETFFANADLDFEPETIIRREILPSGKSRAFINDTPVTLVVLNALKDKLINVHSQHQTAELSDVGFQFSVIDALAQNTAEITSYKTTYANLKALQQELQDLQAQQKEANLQYDYNLHLFNELETAKILPDEQDDLEQNLTALNNVEAIKEALAEGYGLASNEELGIQNQLYSLEHHISKIADFGATYQTLLERITSLKIEFDDVVSELERANETVEFNPTELERLNDRLQLLYNLQKKHYVATNKELLDIQAQLNDKISKVTSAEDQLNALQAKINKVTKTLDAIAAKITASRQKAIPKLTTALEHLMADLGMENARFSIKISPNTTFLTNGKDQLEFLFSANKGGNFGDLKKVASGGELSRIMLSIKKILSEHTQLPTIIFDEIDTGVSGEVSNKIAAIMQQMSANMQVIAITHLPQIAAKGNYHYKVYKDVKSNITTTNLVALTKEDRIKEIAEMLSGKDLTTTALEHAKQLLN